MVEKQAYMSKLQRVSIGFPNDKLWLWRERGRSEWVALWGFFRGTICNRVIRFAVIVSAEREQHTTWNVRVTLWVKRKKCTGTKRSIFEEEEYKEKHEHVKSNGGRMDQLQIDPIPGKYHSTVLRGGWSL